MFVSTDRKSGKSAFLEEKARNREDREQGRKKNDSAIKIQKQVRGFICRRRLEKERLADAIKFMEETDPFPCNSTLSSFLSPETNICSIKLSLLFTTTSYFSGFFGSTKHLKPSLFKT